MACNFFCGSVEWQWMHSFNCKGIMVNKPGILEHTCMSCIILLFVCIVCLCIVSPLHIIILDIDHVTDMITMRFGVPHGD